mmetsp:Transcript_47118/g.102801  ORF Transcript_47118/g.102801 Transcript_47118/m.102801 type:complete len:268 (+) Transcript_47118:332-1135(+)
MPSWGEPPRQKYASSCLTEMSAPALFAGTSGTSGRGGGGFGAGGPISLLRVWSRAAVSAPARRPPVSPSLGELCTEWWDSDFVSSSISVYLSAPSLHRVLWSHQAHSTSQHCICWSGAGKLFRTRPTQSSCSRARGNADGASAAADLFSCAYFSSAPVGSAKRGSWANCSSEIQKSGHEASFGFRPSRDFRTSSRASSVGQPAGLWSRPTCRRSSTQSTTPSDGGRWKRPQSSSSLSGPQDCHRAGTCHASFVPISTGPCVSLVKRA